MIATLFLTILGLADSIYLTFEHYSNVIPPCTLNRFLTILSDCGLVLRSPYSVMFGIPIAVIGVVSYSILSIAIILSLTTDKKIFRYWVVGHAIIGALASLVFMYIQLGIIKSICIYCTASALISFIVVILVYGQLKKERYEMHETVYKFFYQTILKPFYFLFDPEFVHERMVDFGQAISKTFLIQFIGSKLIYKDKSLRQKILGINFENPVGLAAGFDYDAKLTNTLYYLDFGFQTAGTVTAHPYAGNPPPRLGRLPNSKSLMVNKGFKNQGSLVISEKIKNTNFKIPVGISIGVTNSRKLSSIEDAVADIILAFKVFEKSNVKNSYYELNISCPNLLNTDKISFYPPKNLKRLLESVDKLKLKKPVFVKMPIEETDRVFMRIIDELAKHKTIKGVVIGNLYHRNYKNNDSFDKKELARFRTGNFSGKPCEPRSNELIVKTYKKYGDKLVIIGTGGIFSAADAYKKIKLGASLVQLITGMIYQGPQLISQINLGLIDLIKKDGFKNIGEAVGSLHSP